jgi:hypothetical protein
MAALGSLYLIQVGRCGFIMELKWKKGVSWVLLMSW